MQALHQGKQLAGKMGGEVPRGMQGLVEPQVPWQEVLRDLIKQTCKGSGDSSWRKFSRRHLGSDIYLPHNIDHRVGKILVAVDTSGSIGGVILDTFLSEVKSICDEVRPESVDLLYWDWSVAGRETYTDGEYDSLVEQTKPSGGGGTNPDCIPAYIKEHSLNPEITIVLTDGYYSSEGDWSGLSAPILWCVVDHKSYESQTGKVIHIKT
jgi:predicted metal-dependent peptidase